MSSLSTRAFTTPAALPAVTVTTPVNPNQLAPASPAVIGAVSDADLSVILPKVTPQPDLPVSGGLRFPIGSSRDVRIPRDAIVTPIGSMPADGTKRAKQLDIHDVLGGPHRSPNPTARDRVLPFTRPDYTGGVDGRPGDAVPDRLRTPLYVKSIYDADEVSMNDVQQQSISDCYILAPIAAVARQNPQAIKDMITDNGDGTYTVRFKERVPYSEPPQYQDKPITVSGDFPGGLDSNSHAKPGDANVFGQREIWPLVLEKACEFYLGGNEAASKDGYDMISGGGPSARIMEAIAGRPVKSDPEGFVDLGISQPIYLGGIQTSYDEMKADFDSGKAIVISTPNVPSGLNYNLVPAHVYTVQNVYTDTYGREWVELYNPWGYNQPERIPFDQINKGDFNGIVTS
jgi:hypothetical protein